MREAARLPDGGDPLVREASRRRRLSQSAMIFAGGDGALGMPSVARAPLGKTGAGGF